MGSGVQTELLGWHDHLDPGQKRRNGIPPRFGLLRPSIIYRQELTIEDARVYAAEERDRNRKVEECLAALSLSQELGPHWIV